MFSRMCKFVFVKDNSNSVLLLILRFFQIFSISAAPRCILHRLGRSEYMSSRGIARLFYLNRTLLYIIYLCFWQSYFQYVLCVLSMLSVGLIKPQGT